MDQIGQMNQQIQKEGDMHADILKSIAGDVTKEITKSQEEVRPKAVEGLKNNLNSIYDSVKDTLRPDNVDVLLAEALETIKILQGEMKSADAKKSTVAPPAEGSEAEAPEPEAAPAKTKTSKKRGKSR